MNQKKYAQVDQYQLVKSLGAGYNAKVKLGYNPQNQQYYAIKIFKKIHSSEKNRESLKKEYEMMKLLNHPNLINLIEIKDNAQYIKKNQQAYNCMAIVIEYAKGGELFEFISQGGMFREEIARKYFQQLVEGLEYLHGQGICHRDLKPENLLLDDNFSLKIADFGFATALAGKDNSGLLRTILGTEGYMAPEINAKAPYSGTAVDIFAAGIILFIMISGHPPFSKADPKVCPYYRCICTNKHAMFWNAHSKSKPNPANFYSEDLKKLFNALFAQDPAQRPTIAEIKAHPWYNGPTATLEQISLEFKGRAELVQMELERQKKERELARQQRLQQQQQGQNQPVGGIMYTGLKMRGRDEVCRDFEQLEIEFPELKLEREIKEIDDSVAPFAPCVTTLDKDYVLRLILQDRAQFSNDGQLVKGQYKIKLTHKNELNDVVQFVIELFSGRDEVTYVDFRKTEGDTLHYRDQIQKVKTIIEQASGVKKAQNTPLQLVQQEIEQH